MTDASSPSAAAIARRIKQHVHAPVHTWFAPCAPGLEPVLERELQALGVESLEPTSGGVAFKGKLDVGYQANLWLRSANRVLLRVADFKAKRPEDLFRHAHKLPWEALIASDVPLRIQLSSVGSWLSHEDVVERTMRDAIRKRLSESGVDSGVADARATAEDEVQQRLLLRIEQDHVQVSLDSSGDHLHRRGYRKQMAKAPLRENLAAGILLSAGYDGTEPLLDPMAGSGTFGIEGAWIARHLPPGLGRAFLFERWPSFRSAAWEYVKRKVREQALSEAPFSIVLRDNQAGAVRACEANLEAAGVTGNVDLELADFFKALPPGDRPGLVVMNPPYGVRIGESDQIGPMYQRIGDRLRSRYQGWRFAILVPMPSLIAALRLPIDQSVRLPHGGLTVLLVTGTVASS